MDNEKVKDDQFVGAEPLATTAGSSNPTNDETGERHPLLMEDILDNVFKYINNRDLLNARLVCKAWRWSATKLPKLTSRWTMGQYEQWVARFRSFLDTMKNSELLPVKTFKIYCNMLTTTEEEDETELLGDFFQICGPEIVNLAIHIFQMPKVGRMRKIKIPKEVTLGKLKKLHLAIDNCKDEALLKHSHILAGLILDSTATTLQKFEYRYDSRLFKSLTNKGLQLKKLLLTDNVNPKSMEESESIRKFIRTQTATLQRLEICNGYSLNLSCSLTLPMLQELEHLKFGNVKITPFVADEMFPKLRCLDVRSWRSGICPDIIIVKQPSTTLKALWLPSRYPSERIRKLSLDFPLITELHIGGETIDDVLEQVRIHFPLLKHLELSFSCLDCDGTSIDSLICGIPADVCERIRLLSLIDFQNLDNSELQQKPSLVDFTLLEKLEITNWGEDGPTDISAELLFLRLPNLKELKIKHCLFSNAYIKKLKEHIPNVNFQPKEEIFNPKIWSKKGCGRTRGGQ